MNPQLTNPNEASRPSTKKSEYLSLLAQESSQAVHEILDILSNLYQSRTAALYIYDPVKDEFLPSAHVSSSKYFQAKVEKAEHIFRLCPRVEKPTIIQGSHRLLSDLPYYRLPVVTKSLWLVPIMNEKFLQAVLFLDFEEQGMFSEDSIELLSRFGKQISRAISHLKSSHQFYVLQNELSTVFDASTALNQCFRLQEVLETLLSSSRKMVSYDLGLTVLHDKDAGENRVAFEMGPSKLHYEGQSFQSVSQDSLISWSIENQTPLYYSDFCRRSPRSSLFDRKWKVPNIFESVLILPLIVRGECLGASVFFAQKKNVFSTHARKMLELINQHAAVSIKNAQMVGSLEQLATTDGLTGVYNHRSFQEILQSEMERCDRHSSPISLLLLDIDHFKKFNDTHGHPVGDFVLKNVAQKLEEGVRKIDYVARYGGEEFAIILLNTRAEQAQLLAQRIVRDMSEQRFEIDGKALQVSISLGVASYPALAHCREALIEKADKALYHSKQNGRNQATLYSARLLGKERPERPQILRRRVDHLVQAI